MRSILLFPVFFAVATALAQDPMFTERFPLGGDNRFPALIDMQSAWGDFDRDGDLDVVMSGASPNGPVTRLYERYLGGQGATYREMTVASLPQVQDGALAWGDIDRDGDLDLAISGSVSAGAAVGDLRGYVLLNNGPDGTGGWSFQLPPGPSFPPCRFGTLSWGDIDNDGFADLFVSGERRAAAGDLVPFSRIYLNAGGGLTTTGPEFLTPSDPVTPLPAGQGSLTRRVSWVDINKDSYLDLILTSDDPTFGDDDEFKGVHRQEVWVNREGAENAPGSFGKRGTSVSSANRIWGSPVPWAQGYEMWAHTGVGGGVGDWDGDGRSDLAFWTITDGNRIQRAHVLHQHALAADGDSLIPGFSLVPIPGILSHGAYGGVLTWTAGDFLNAGTQQWLGSVLIDTLDGQYYPPPVMRLFGDNGALSLSEISNQHLNLTARFRGVLDGVDVDRDGWLDVFHSGFTDEGGNGVLTPRTTLNYHNRLGIPRNEAPAAPGNLVAVANPGEIVFNWSAPADDHTPSAALRYAVSLRNSADVFLIRPSSIEVSVLGQRNGVRFIPGFDGTLQSTSFVYRPRAGQELPDDTYRWTVQAIDSAGEGSTFAPEQPFTLFWGAARPGDREIGMAYRDTAIDLGDVEGDGDLDAVLAGHSATVYYPHADTTVVSANEPGSFQTIKELPALELGAVRWGDVDGDGDLDLAISGRSLGQPITRVYRNNEGNLVLRNILEGVEQSALDWADFDNDGDFDLIVTGYRANVPATRLYRNGGADNIPTDDLSAQETTLPDIGSGAVAWGDYDRDGDLDLLLCGDTQRYDRPAQPCSVPPYYLRPPNTYYMCGNPALPQPQPVTTLFRNDGLAVGGLNAGKWQFTPVPAGFPAVVGRSGGMAITARAEWCDLSGDGFPDLVLGGLFSVSGQPGYATPSVRVFRNAGAGGLGQWSFLQSQELLTGAISRALQTLTCADWDNDGRPDILVSGQINSAGNVPTQVIHNDGMIFTRHSYLRSLDEGDLQFASGLAAFGHFDEDASVDVILSGMWGLRSTPVSRRGGVRPGSSILMGQVDYSDTFTGTDAGGSPGRSFDATLQSPPAYVVESTFENQQMSFQSGNFFSFASDAGQGMDPQVVINHYPYWNSPDASDAGSDTGMAQSFGDRMDYSIIYGVRNEYTVQVDAVQTADRVHISSGATPGVAGTNSLSVFIRGDGTRGVALYDGLVETNIPGFDSGITGPREWHNYAVRFDRIKKEITIFIDQVSRGRIDLKVFTGGRYKDFSNAVVGAGAISGGVGFKAVWTDNFQAGSYVSPVEWGTVGNLFLNDTQEDANLPPSAPLGLAASVSGTEINFSWQPASDDHTPVPGLTYNLHIERVDGQPGGMPGMADPATGTRLICRPGNAGNHTSWRLADLPAGEYRWSVQAIDAALATSAFTTAAQTFTAAPPQPPVITHLPPLHTWVVGNPALSAVDLLGVAAGRNARLVAGRRGRLLLSRNQEPFAEVESGVFTDLHDVMIDAEGAIAVGEAGVIRTSVDGVIWREATSGVSATLRAVVRGGNGWVAAGDDVILNSSDRHSWTAGTMPAGTVVHDIVWSMGMHVAVGEKAGTGVILTSTNGVTWTDVSPPGLQAGRITGVGSDGSKFVAVGGVETFPGTRRDVLTSTNGLVWTLVQTANTAPMLKIVHSTDGWFAVSENDFLRSTDAVAWNSIYSQSFLRVKFAALAVEGGLLTAAGAAGAVRDSPVSPVLWTRRSGNGLNTYGTEPIALAALGDTLVAVGESGMQYVSHDAGRTWQGSAFLVGDGFYGVAAGAGKMVRTHYQGLDWSSDGVTWTTVAAFRPREIVFGNGRFVATRGFGGFHVSTNGVAWSAVSTTTPEGKALAFGNGQFMALDAAGNVHVSSDGSSWAAVGQVTATRLSFAYDRFFAISSFGLDVRSSVDGVTWQPVTGLPPGVVISRIIRHRDRYIAIGGPNATLLTSPDALTWTAIPIPASGMLTAALSIDAGLLIAGAGHALLLAPDSAAPSPPPVTTSLSITASPFPGIFFFSVTGRAGQQVTLERSANLTNWTAVDTFTLSGGAETLEVHIPNPQPADYFRLRWTP